MKIKQRFRNFTKTHSQLVLFMQISKGGQLVRNIYMDIYRNFSTQQLERNWNSSVLHFDKLILNFLQQQIRTDQIRSDQYSIGFSSMPRDPDTLHCVTAYTHTNKINCSLIWHIWYNTLISWYLCILHFSFSWCCCCLMLFYLEEIYISRSIKKSGTFHVCFILSILNKLIITI